MIIRKIDHKLAETTWVHKIFGGRLRSRVTCLSCHYNSDTFDSILDLSVDIYGVNSLKDALRKFVAIDHLKGADKYKCEKYVLFGIPSTSDSHLTFISDVRSPSQRTSSSLSMKLRWCLQCT